MSYLLIVNKGIQVDYILICLFKCTFTKVTINFCKNLFLLKLTDMFPVAVWKFYYKLMNDQLPIYFVDWKPVLPRVCTRYEIRSPTFHLPLIRHKFAENTLRYCLIKQLNREKCSFLITAKVHTHSYQGYKIYLNIMLLIIIMLIVIFLNAMFAKN